MDGPIEDIEFIARSPHRAAVLDRLADGPRDRATLIEETGASNSTVGRILGDFEDRHWLRRAGRDYELTPLGAFVAERFGSLVEGMAVERKLRDVWAWLPREMPGFSVDLFADAVVSYPGPGYPYDPIERVGQLIDGTDSMRGFGTTVFKSGNLETLHRNVLDGMVLEYVYSPPVLETVLDWDRERARATVSHHTSTILLHDDLTDETRCGLCLFDDRIGICCHDADTGLLRAVVDTESPAAREWAESVYRPYREAARPLEPERVPGLRESA